MHMNTNSVTDTHQHQIQYNQHQSLHCHFYYPVICGKDSSCHEKLVRRPANEKSHHNHHHQSHHLWLWCEGGQGTFPVTKTDHTAPQVVPGLKKVYPYQVNTLLMIGKYQRSLCPILIWSQPATHPPQLTLSSSHFIHEVRVEWLISRFKVKFIAHYFLYGSILIVIFYS